MKKINSCTHCGGTGVDPDDSFYSNAISPCAVCGGLEESEWYKIPEAVNALFESWEKEALASGKGIYFPFGEPKDD